uniref:complement C3-like n=1 Tax=Pristiophorus japonicus TaxID=55135 RepID=UPI00398F3A72
MLLTQTSVTNPDGSPAPDVTLQVSINISGETTTTDDNVGLTDKIGEQSFVIHVPPHTQHINITAIAGTDDRTKSKTFAAVRKHKSPSKRYLHINVPHVFLYPGDIINVTLTAISQLDIHDLHHFYYMVLGKGKVLDFRTVERVEETTVQLPITQDMVPYFRIVAYYILDANGTEEIIADSLRVEVESPCDTKFQVDSALYKKHGRSYQLSLSVLSNSAAEVYVQTVDISLKEQHKQDTITMRKVLEALDSYDIGSSYGRSGTDAVSVFKDSGLHFFSNLLPELPGPAFNVSSMRRLRTVPGNKTSSSISDNHPPSSWKIQALNTSVKDDRGHLISPTFNGSSMWKLNTVPGNKISRLISDIHLPQSWEIQVLSMSAEDGLCLAKHKEVRLDGNDFQPRISSTALAREGEAHLHGDD